MNGKLILVHAELFHHLHKSLYREGIVLHGNAEFLFDIFFLDIAVFHQLVLFHHLSGVTEKLFSLRCHCHAPVCPLEKLKSYLIFQLLDRSGKAGL